MKPQTLMMLVIAVACALVAMFLTQQFLRQPDKIVGDDVTSVLVAAVEVQPGTLLNETILKSREYPKSLLPEGSFTEPKQLEGRSTRYHMGANEVITLNKLAPEGVKGGLETVVPEGKRAVTLRLPTDRSVAGFIKPDAHVDVTLNMPSMGPNKPPVSKVILQDVRVLAVNAEMQNEGGPDNKGKLVEMVTFLVVPEDAQKLALAQQHGTLTLSLRSSVDKNEVALKAVTLDDLLADKKGDEEEPDPEKVVLDESKVVNKAKSGAFDKVLNNLLGGPRDAKKPVDGQDTQVIEKTPVPPPAPAAPIVRKKLKRLVYRDLMGKKQMEVLLDAESKLATSLQHLLEEVNPETLDNPPMASAATERQEASDSEDP